MQADASESSPNQLWSLTNSLLLSITVMAKYVNFARNIAIRDIRELALKWNFLVVDRAMLNSRWCVGEVEFLSDDCNPSIRYYLSTIDRHGLRKNHQKCDRLKGCHALQVDYNSYRTHHTRDCTDAACKEVSIQIHKVADSIEEGQTPLVVMNSPLDAVATSPSLTKHDHAESNHPRYVAISHV